jgi:hypothetical protein
VTFVLRSWVRINHYRFSSPLILSLLLQNTPSVESVLYLSIIVLLLLWKTNGSWSGHQYYLMNLVLVLILFIGIPLIYGHLLFCSFFFTDSIRYARRLGFNNIFSVQKKFEEIKQKYFKANSFFKILLTFLKNNCSFTHYPRFHGC